MREFIFMKKVMCFAAALSVFVACSKKENAFSEPGQQVPLHATVDNTVKGLNNVSSLDSSVTTVNFVWQAGDQVIIKNGTEASTFTIVGSETGDVNAEFSGTALSDMTNYEVYYGYDPGQTSQTIPYIEGSFRPCIMGNGHDDGFSLNEFFPVLKFQLKGEVTLGKMEYYIGADLMATMPFPGGLALNETAPAKVYFPVANVDAAGFTLKFYDNADTPTLIMVKNSTANLTGESGMVFAFPELEVKAAPEIELVDLGLPNGTLWMKCNLGASCETESGLYYSWGNIDGHAIGSDSTTVDGYQFCSKNYNGTPGQLYTGNVLDAAHDAVYQATNGVCCLPTKEQVQELYEYTDNYWTEIKDENGNYIQGYQFTSKKDSKQNIFFPAASQCLSKGRLDKTPYLRIWSSTRIDDTNAYCIFFLYGDGRCIRGIRPCGFPLRGVKSPALITKTAVRRSPENT